MYYIAQTVFTPNDLTHYGVAGMRWGHRNAKSQNGDNNIPSRKDIIKQKTKRAVVKTMSWVEQNPEQAAIALSIASSILGQTYNGAKAKQQQHKQQKNAEKIKAYDDMKEYYIRKQNKYENAYVNTTNKYKQNKYEDGYNKADKAALNAYRKSNKLKGV